MRRKEVGEIAELLSVNQHKSQVHPPRSHMGFVLTLACDKVRNATTVCNFYDIL